jgi:hypothetical protein
MARISAMDVKRKRLKIEVILLKSEATSMSALTYLELGEIKFKFLGKTSNIT